MAADAADTFQPEIVALSEHAWLVRLCGRLSGNADAAEDLAQETLLEAWRHRGKLHDPGGRLSWLAAIARNICSRWRQDQSHHRTVRYAREDGIAFEASAESLADGFDPEVELERHELADLLDRAMALLPPDTRTVLIERYVRESTHDEIAERLHLSGGAVRVRVHRGKLALQRILQENFTEEAVAYGLETPDPTAWESSRIWCPICAQHRLGVRFVPERGEFIARCPRCHESDLTLTHTELPDVLRGVKGRKAVLNRVLTWSHGYVADALARRPVRCPECRHVGPVAVEAREDDAVHARIHVAYVRCHGCGVVYNCELPGYAWSLPEARRFWQQHPRIRTLLGREFEADGGPALLTRFESVVDASCLDVILAVGTFRVLGVHGALSGPSADD